MGSTRGTTGDEGRSRNGPRWTLLLAVAFAVVVADQLTKELIRSNLHPGQAVHVVGVTLRHLQNPGIAGGGFAGDAAPLSLIATAAVLGILGFLCWAGVARPFVLVGFGLLIGGGLGNLLDRLRLGYVTDFILREDRAFNIADVAIMLGGGVVMIGLVLLLPQVRAQNQPTRSGG
jgi:signal peptidase II